VNGGGFALPRIRVRSRRRRPRTPWWRFWAGLFCAWLALLAWHVLDADAVGTAAAVCGTVFARRKMRQRPADPEAPVLTTRDVSIDLALNAGVWAGILAGVLLK
jgi:hypothetical protein